MPTYEYACKTCGEHLEVVQSFRDEPLTECPACGGRLRKVFGAIGVVLKGSGFYRTDNRAAGKRGTRESKSDSKAESGAASESKSAESKSADSKSASDKPKNSKSSKASA